MTKETSIGAYWSRRNEHARLYYATWNDRYGRMLAFSLDQQHYKSDRGLTNDRRLVQPRGQALFNLIRHKAAVISGSPISFQCRPVQPVADGGRAELSQRLLERVIFDPLVRYRQARHRFVLSFLAGGRGVMAIEHLLDGSPNGHVAFRVADPRRFHVAPGFVDIHDRRTPWVQEEVVAPLDWVMEQRANGWRIPAELQLGDDLRGGAPGALQDWSQYDPRSDSNSQGDQPGETEHPDGKTVLLLRSFVRNDPWKKKRRVAIEDLTLPRDQWYFTDDLGLNVPAQADLDDPNFVPPMSPSTQQPMRLVTTEEEDRAAYPDGRMFITVKGHDKPLFDDSWTPKTRTFPYMFQSCYQHPLRLVGRSDSEINHSMQVVDNAVLKNAYDQTRLAQAILIMRKNGLKDQEGRAFQPSDEPMQIAVADNLVDSEAIKFFQSPGMNSTLPAFYQMVQNQWALIGTGDIKMPDQRSRDIPVGTIQAIQQVGELPSKIHVQTLQAEESVGFGVVLDILRDTMSVQDMLSWVTDAGEVQFMELTGRDLTPVNVVVDSQADWRGMDVDRVQAIAQFMGQIPPQMWGTLGKTAGFPPEAVREMTMMSQQMQMQQTMQPPPTEGGGKEKPAAKSAA